MFCFSLQYLFVCTVLIVQYVLCKDSFTNVKLVGCYSVVYADRMDLGLSFTPFSWESCVNLCRSKASRYAGLVQRKHMCYCGSYLVENSRRFQSSQCPYACRGAVQRECGGDKKMTIYQLKDDTSPRLLVSTPAGISYVENNKLTLIIAIDLGNTHTSMIDYHYKYNEIYFTQNQHLYRSKYSTLNNGYSSPNTLSGLSHVTSFSLDWVSDKIYYILDDKDVYQADLNGENRELVTRKEESSSYIFVDPYEKKLFYSVCGIKEFDLIKRVERKLTTYCFNSASLNTHSQYFYGWPDVKVQRFQYMEDNIDPDFNIPMDIKNMSFTVVDDHTIFTIELFNVYSYTEIGQKKFIADLGKSRISEIKALHEVVQAPTKMTACEKLGCSHECEYSPQSYARCLCPNDMQLTSEGRKCTYITRPQFSSEMQQSRDHSDVTSSESDEISKKRKCSGSDESSESSNRSESEGCDECDECHECDEC